MKKKKRTRPSRNRSDLDRLPDVRDGLTRVERAILTVLAQAQKERGRGVPTPMLYGRVLELVDVSQEEFQETLTRLVGKRVK
ncbi:MAG TPA: hypothetical protein VGK67_36120 [Myxococcales bacterium]|jgi:hypothetical protein